MKLSDKQVTNVHLDLKVWILADEIVDERGLNVWTASHLQVLEAGLLLTQPLQKASAGTKYMYLHNSMPLIFIQPLPRIQRCKVVHRAGLGYLEVCLGWSCNCNLVKERTCTRTFQLKGYEEFEK